MNQEVISKLEKIVGQDWVDINQQRVLKYSKDSTNESYVLIAPEPEKDNIIIKPANYSQISSILKYANKKNIPVIPKGGGTGLAANSVPSRTSIIISMERFNNIIEIDEENMMITCQSGVTLSKLNDSLNGKEGLYFPLHPGDEGAHVGGMVATNAGGVRAVKHGIMRNQVRGMKVILSNGEVVYLGGKYGKLIKNNAGYDLMHLLIGSEGTLGIIVEVVLQLYPEPEANGTLVVSFNDRKDAFSAVQGIIRQGIIPLAIEYVEGEHVEKAAEHLGKEWPIKVGDCYLLIILAERQKDDLYNLGMKIEEIAQKYSSLQISIAETIAEQRDIIEIRSHILPAIENEIVDAPDIAVPRSEIINYLNKIDKLAEKYDTDIPALAHAGDGNIHIILLKEDGGIPSYYEELKGSIYKEAVKCGGSITAEHGIGSLRLEHLPLMYSDKELDIMRKIKKAFDPNNILNPGKAILM